MRGLMIGGLGACSANELREYHRGTGVDWLDPRILARNPKLAVRLRLNILMRCYSGDYHGDIGDEDRLVSRVADGTEQILIWGLRDHVATVAEMVASKAELHDNDFAALSLGTHTTLPGDDLYGHGHLEIARTGTAHQQAGQAAQDAIRWDVARLLVDIEPQRPFHTISCVPRNRRTAPGIPGGTAIHRIHTRSLGTGHWGLAPFYVMAGNILEVLDYRELSVNDNSVPNAFANRPVIHVADTGTADLVRRLCMLNGFDPDIAITEAAPVAHDVLKGQCKLQDADPHGPRVVAIDTATLTDCLSRAIWPRGEACTSAVCDLEDPAMLNAQATLLANGFQLTYVSPPKMLRDPTNRPVRLPMRGGFTCIRTPAPLAIPYYLEEVSLLSSTEAQLAGQYRALINEHMRGTTT